MLIEKLDSKQRYLPGKKLRVAAYARVSADSEKSEASINNQTKTYMEQIKSNPEWEYVEVYEDNGISGTKEKRPAFQRMMSDCRDGKIDLILTKSFTRFARNTVVLLETLRELKSLNVEVVFEKDNIRSSDETGEFLITLLAAYAQAEAESASANVTWRIQKRFEEGRLVTGLNMLGYRARDGIITVVPEEAKIVRMIFDDYLSGKGYRAIAKKLNQMGIKGKYDASWCANSVKQILSNEKYTGTLVLQKTYTVDPISKKELRNNGERKKYLVKNNHEAIVSMEQFEAVKEERVRRTPKYGTGKSQPAHRHRLLTKKIFCGACGRSYWRRHNRPERLAWDCSTKVIDGVVACDNPRIFEDVLLEKIKEALNIDEINDRSIRNMEKIVVMKDCSLHFIFRDGSTKDIPWSKKQKKKSNDHDESIKHILTLPVNNTEKEDN